MLVPSANVLHVRATSHYGHPSQEAVGVNDPNFVERPKKKVIKR